MKTTYVLISLLVSFCYLPLHAGTYTIDQNQTISLTTGYIDNMSETWNIVSTTADKPLKITYNIGTESNYDFVTIYSVDNSGNLTKLIQLSGTQSGSVYTLVPTGKARITFTSDGSASYASNSSLYTGLNISFSVDNSTTMSDNLYVSGNMGVGTTAPSEKLDVRGNVLVGTTYKIKLMDFPGCASWIDMPAVVGKASGIGSGGAGSNAWVGYTGLANQWFVGSQPGDICYRNSNGRLIFGNLASNPVMAINESNVGIGTLNPQSKLDVVGCTHIQAPTSSDLFNAMSIDVLSFGTATNAAQSSFFKVSDVSGNSTPFIVKGNGKVGIGTANPDQSLTVNGKIHATEVIVDLAIPADYVFKPTYKLMPLHEVEQFVKTNSHLPEIPSAGEITKNGLSMGEMQNKLLQKVEELTLYMIGQQKTIDQQQAQIKELNSKLSKLDKQ